MEVELVDYAPNSHTLDVLDVKLPDGREESIYDFNIDEVVSIPSGRPISPSPTEEELVNVEQLPTLDKPKKIDELLEQLSKEIDPAKKEQIKQHIERIKKASLNVTAHIKHEDGKWVVYSHDYSKKLGTYPTKEKALKRLRQIEFWKSKKGNKVRPFSKKAESLIDPYQALTQQISEMRSRMADVQQRLESNPLPKTAGADEKDNSELSVEDVFSDVAMGLDLLEVKLKDEPESEELHKGLEELENLLWETEQKAGIKPELSDEEKAEPEHKEIVEEVEASEKGRKPRNLVHKEYKDELTKEELEDEPVEKEAQAPMPNNPAMGTPVTPAPQQNQPTDEDNLDVAVTAPTSPAAPGFRWVYDPVNKKYISMPNASVPPGQTI